MNFKIMNRNEAIRYSYKNHEEESIIISISSFNDVSPKFNFANKDNGINAILYLHFDDVNDSSSSV